jgi:hypothetical protein
MTGKRKDMSMVFVLPVLLGFLCLCFFFCFLSCKLKSTDTEIDPAQKFSKIYDKDDKSNYTAVDIKQTGDGGYIILGRKDNHSYLLRVNGQGLFQWDTANDEDLKIYTNPIADLIIFDQEYYFFCNGRDEEVEYLKPIALLKASEDDHKTREVELSGDITDIDVASLLSATVTPDDRFLLVSFDEDYSELVVSKIDNQYESEVQSYEIFYECAYLHPFKDKRFHISGMMEPSGSQYYFFQSYWEGGVDEYPTCFSITAFEDDFQSEPLPLDTPFIAMELDGAGWDGTGWEGIKISGARIDNGIISFFVNTQLKDVDGEEGDPQTELIASKAAYVKIMDVNSKRIVFFAGSSKDNRIVLYAYDYSIGDSSGDKYLSKKYFGHTHIYEAAGLIETDDRGLAILCTTFVAGRLGRICLFKLSKTDLEDMIKKPSN